MLDVGVILTVFALIFVSELPDKSAFATLVLGTKFPVRWVFIGVAAAFAVHVVIAVAAGHLLTLLPDSVVQPVVAALFVVGAILIWREGSKSDEEEDASGVDRLGANPKPWRISALGFGVIFIGEWGDLTQIMTANLAAKYEDPLSVGIGALLGLCGVALTAMFFGKSLLRILPLQVITRVAAVVMLGLAVYTMIGVLNG